MNPYETNMLKLVSPKNTGVPLPDFEMERVEDTYLKITEKSGKLNTIHFYYQHANDTFVVSMTDENDQPTYNRRVDMKYTGRLTFDFFINLIQGFMYDIWEAHTLAALDKARVDTEIKPPNEWQKWWIYDQTATQLAIGMWKRPWIKKHVGSVFATAIKHFFATYENSKQAFAANNGSHVSPDKLEFLGRMLELLDERDRQSITWTKLIIGTLEEHHDLLSDVEHFSMIKKYVMNSPLLRRSINRVPHNLSPHKVWKMFADRQYESPYKATNRIERLGVTPPNNLMYWMALGYSDRMIPVLRRYATRPELFVKHMGGIPKKEYDRDRPWDRFFNRCRNIIDHLNNHPADARYDIPAIIERHREEWKRNEIARTPIMDTCVPRGTYEIEAANPGLRLLRTSHEIVQEGIEMRHCVGGYWQSAALGDCSIWHYEYKGEHSTIELDRNGRVVQAQGIYNSHNKACTYAKDILEKAFKDGLVYESKPDQEVLDRQLIQDEVPF